MSYCTTHYDVLCMTPCHYVLYHEFRHFSSHALQHNDDIHSLQLLWKCETYLITSHRDTWHPYVSYTITCYDQSEFIKFIKQSTAACLVPFTSNHLKHQHGQVWSQNMNLLHEWFNQRRLLHYIMHRFYSYTCVITWYSCLKSWGYLSRATIKVCFRPSDSNTHKSPFWTVFELQFQYFLRRLCKDDLEVCITASRKTLHTSLV